MKMYENNVKIYSLLCQCLFYVIEKKETEPSLNYFVR